MEWVGDRRYLRGFRKVAKERLWSRWRRAFQFNWVAGQP